MKKPDKCLFIIGSPRSGTTWLQKILASHSVFVTGQESEFFTSFAAPILNKYQAQFDKPSGRGGTGLPAYFTRQEMFGIFATMFYKMVDKVEEDLHNKIFIEKTPSHALVVDIINEALPESLFIHIVRSPADVAASMMSAAQTWGQVWAPKNIFTASRMWKRHYLSALRSLNSIPKERKIVVRYEDMKAFPHQIISEIVDHFLFPIGKSAIDTMIDNATSYKLKLYGEFSMTGVNEELLPEGFARVDDKKQKLARQLNAIEKLFLKIYLYDEMKDLGYLDI